MTIPGTSSKGSQNIAEWLPLLGSIVQALRGMAADDRIPDDRIADHRIAARTPAAARDGKPNPGETAR